MMTKEQLNVVLNKCENTDEKIGAIGALITIGAIDLTTVLKTLLQEEENSYEEDYDDDHEEEDYDYDDDEEDYDDYEDYDYDDEEEDDDEELTLEKLGLTPKDHEKLLVLLQALGIK